MAEKKQKKDEEALVAKRNLLETSKPLFREVVSFLPLKDAVALLRTKRWFPAENKASDWGDTHFLLASLSEYILTDKNNHFYEDVIEANKNLIQHYVRIVHFQGIAPSREFWDVFCRNAKNLVSWSMESKTKKGVFGDLDDAKLALPLSLRHFRIAPPSNQRGEIVTQFNAEYDQRHNQVFQQLFHAKEKRPLTLLQWHRPNRLKLSSFQAVAPVLGNLEQLHLTFISEFKSELATENLWWTTLASSCPKLKHVVLMCTNSSQRENRQDQHFTEQQLSNFFAVCKQLEWLCFTSNGVWQWKLQNRQTDTWSFSYGPWFDSVNSKYVELAGAIAWTGKKKWDKVQYQLNVQDTNHNSPFWNLLGSTLIERQIHIDDLEFTLTMPEFELIFYRNPAAAPFNFIRLLTEVTRLVTFTGPFTKPYTRFSLVDEGKEKHYSFVHDDKVDKLRSRFHTYLGTLFPRIKSPLIKDAPKVKSFKPFKIAEFESFRAATSGGPFKPDDSKTVEQNLVPFIESKLELETETALDQWTQEAMNWSLSQQVAQAILKNQDLYLPGLMFLHSSTKTIDFEVVGLSKDQQVILQNKMFPSSL